MKELSFYCLVHVSRLRVGMKKAPGRVLFLSAVPSVRAMLQWVCLRDRLFYVDLLIQFDFVSFGIVIPVCLP